MIAASSFSWRFWRVWQRNVIVYRRIWKVNFLVPLFEPAFYILAFGLGFRQMIGDVSYAGATLSYTEFIAPALVATSVMWNAFFETTYSSFVRMYYQKTFDAMLATPLSLEEIIVAEIAWSATKAAAAALLMLVVLMLLGYVVFPLGLLAVIWAFLGGLAFGAIGMYFTGIVPTIDLFNLPIFLFITPMFLFSGTFFPVSGLPGWAQDLSLVFPLYHLVELTRFVSLGRSEATVLFSIAYLLLFSLFFIFLSLHYMRKKLIK
ncbi:MAG: ABC transporter permease [Deltaproteobacteria bacterium HGW-Deltaproteobacteria-21]|nr:MAG: ABC transporter permease [Deltaproteobacteria bacterium HGW-Deltaproteobacteria-21]